MTWEEELEQALRSGMKYCFAPLPSGSYPTINNEEFLGTEGSQGFLYFMQSFVSDLRKKAFYAGYSYGVVDAMADVGNEAFVLDRDVSKYGASRAWDKEEAK